jgi:hypothetical protein
MKNRMLSPFRNAAMLAAALFIILASPLPLMAADAGSDQQFTSVIDDLPLMPGLTTVEDSDVLFVEPHEGRIAQTEASGNVAVDEVYNFYRRSLPHLGWKVLDDHTYIRDSEKLHIDAHADGNITTVRFSVKPAS